MMTKDEQPEGDVNDTPAAQAVLAPEEIKAPKLRLQARTPNEAGAVKLVTAKELESYTSADSREGPSFVKL